MKLGSAKAQPGERSRGYWEVTDLPTGAPERLPVAIVNGMADGPTAWVTAGVHGDELTSIATAQDVVDAVDPGVLAGAVICLPCVNPAGLRRTNRASYYHDEDPNRQFPDPNRERSRPPQLQERIAERVFEAFAGDRDRRLEADVLLDLHTAQPGAMPFTIRDRVLYDSDPEDDVDDSDDSASGGTTSDTATDTATDSEHLGRTKDDARVLAGEVALLCEAVGLPVVTEYEPDEYTDEDLQRSVAGAAINAAGVPACTVELGGPDVVEEGVRAAGVAGVVRAFAEWGMVDPVPPDVATADPGVTAPLDFAVRRYRGPHTEHAGIVRHHREAGDAVAAGDTVATIVEPTGEKIASVAVEHDGYVLARTTGVTAYEGDPLYSLAVRDDTSLVAPRG